MTQNKSILDALQEDLKDAESKQEKQRQKEQRLAFKSEYRRARKQKNSNIWPTQNYDAGTIYYAENGEKKHDSLRWRTASGLAEKKKKGQISDVHQVGQFDLGRMCASVSRALDAVFDTRGRHNREGKAMFATEALSAMYLLGLTGNRTLLARIEKGIKNPENYEVARTIGALFPYFGMVDEYHSDLFPRGEWIDDIKTAEYARYVLDNISLGALVSVLEAKLRPENLTPEEAFEKGRQQAHADKQYIWSEGVNSAKAKYSVTGKGIANTARLGYSRVFEIAHMLQQGEICDFEIVSDKDKGKLYGSIEKTINRMLMPDVDSRNRSAQEQFARQAIAGIYLLGRLNEPQTVETMRKVIQAKPVLASAVQQELQKYVGAA